MFKDEPLYGLFIVLNSFFAIQSILLGVIFLLKKKRDRVANVLWSTFLLLLGFHLAYCVLYWTKWDIDLARRLDGMFLVNMALYGPLFYLYIGRLIKRKRMRLKEIWPHLVPLLFVLAICGTYFALPLRYRPQVLADKNFFLIKPITVYGILSLTIVFYCLLAAYKYLIKENFKEKLIQYPDGKNWLVSIFACFGFFGLSISAYYFLVVLGALTLVSDYFIGICMGVFAVATTYFGQNCPKVFQGNFSPIKRKEGQSPIKYATTGLSSLLSHEYREKILLTMDRDKLYLDSDLTLSSFAEHLGISRNHASQVINENFNVGFNDFLNKYRIAEARRLLEEAKRSEKIIDIAYSAGFNNKVTFNKAFKKFIGITPSKFLESGVSIGNGQLS